MDATKLALTSRKSVLIGIVAGMLLAGYSPASAQVQRVSRERAVEIARVKGFPVKGTVNGRTYELQSIVNQIPRYYITTNLNAAESVSTKPCWPGGSSGLNLTGTGVKMGVWDEGTVRLTHREVAGRVTKRDGSPGTSTHGTHVGGTMIASGVTTAARGMASSATLDSYDWNSDTTEMNAAAGNGLRVSNHSYGLVTGWEVYCLINVENPEPVDEQGCTFVWIWWGDTRVSAFEDFAFGFYSFEAYDWDAISVANPRYLWVKAAGNDRNDGPAPGTAHYYYDVVQDAFLPSSAIRSLDGNNGYDSISHSGCAKNGLTVGAVNDVIGGYNGTSSVSMSTFSCWGPTDDGRIKPDIVGNGVNLTSSVDSADNAYASFSGTSMASPNVTGSLGILTEHFRNTHSGQPDMLSSTLKGLVIHTADECGNFAGPDYVHGWGLLNTLRAARAITFDQSMPFAITENSISNNQEFQLFAVSDPNSPELRVTICWTDPVPSFTLPDSLDPSTKMLMNDLDLRVHGISQNYQPWRLDPANPTAAATRGDNTTDNVEQVVVATPSSESFRISVTCKGPPVNGSQTFSMIITGAQWINDQPESGAPLVSAIDPPHGATVGSVPSVVVKFNEPVSGVAASALTINGAAATNVTGSGAGPYTFTGLPAVNDGTLNVQLAGGQAKDFFNNVFGGTSWSYTLIDCNDNAVLDGQDIASGTSEDCNLNSLPDECDPAALRLHPGPPQTISYGELMHLGQNGLITGGAPPFVINWTLRGNADGETTSDPNPLFRPEQPGTYVAQVIVTDSMGCTETAFLTINVTESDLAGPLPGGPITVGGGMCPFFGGVSSMVLIVGCVGAYGVFVRRRRR